jgi:hypothetical protein
MTIWVSALMATNKTKTASRSQSKGSTKQKPAIRRAVADPTAKRAATRTVSGAKRTKAAAKRSSENRTMELGAQERADRIAVAAYFLAERRAFAPNHELDDWLAAERSL